MYFTHCRFMASFAVHSWCVKKKNSFSQSERSAEAGGNCGTGRPFMGPFGVKLAPYIDVVLESKPNSSLSLASDTKCHKPSPIWAQGPRFVIWACESISTINSYHFKLPAPAVALSLSLSQLFSFSYGFDHHPLQNASSEQLRKIISVAIKLLFI